MISVFPTDHWQSGVYISLPHCPKMSVRTWQMTTPAQVQTVASTPDQQCAIAFSVAKEVLGYIGTFGTPPIPEVYEVWYRYVEGNNKAIREQLSHSVNVVKSVTTSQLRDLRKQFLADSETSEAHPR